MLAQASTGLLSPPRRHFLSGGPSSLKTATQMLMSTDSLTALSRINVKKSKFNFSLWTSKSDDSETHRLSSNQRDSDHPLKDGHTSVKNQQNESFFSTQLNKVWILLPAVHLPLGQISPSDINCVKSKHFTGSITGLKRDPRCR